MRVPVVAVEQLLDGALARQLLLHELTDDGDLLW
jgi:hypothetical protein